MRLNDERKGNRMVARDLIKQADMIAKSRGISQARWSNLAGRSVHGQTVYRIMANGDCKLSTFIELLDALGCELTIQEATHGQN